MLFAIGIGTSSSVMTLVSALLLAMAWNGTIGYWEAAVLFAGLFVYTGFLFIQGRNYPDGRLTAHASGNPWLWTGAIGAVCCWYSGYHQGGDFIR
jgi:Na+-transporting NADH:ubiquinone oxidoreductase subunit NqrB